MNQASEPVRLSKRVAEQTGCSRSEAERFIEGGWVRVDGVVVDLPQERVAPAQQVTVDAQASRLTLAPVTLLLHQPAGEAALKPQPGNRWPQDPGHQPPGPGVLRQLVPLMPLPAGAGGLAVFSQDRRITRKLTEEALAIEQEIQVDVDGQIHEGGLARLCGGLTWRGRHLPPIKVSWQSERRLRFALKGIDPSLLPWMCEQVGLSVVAIRRIRIGRLPLAGLPAGQWRCLLPHERF